MLVQEVEVIFQNKSLCENIPKDTETHEGELS